MDIKIEDVSISHLNKLYEIEKQCFDQEAFTKQQLTFLLTDSDIIRSAATVNRKIAGFAMAQVDFTRNKQFGHILTVDVLPAYRRNRIAQILLHEIETILREKDAKECHLEVREDNAAALSLYRKLGYAKVGTLKKYYGTKHGLYLKKSL